MPDELDRILSGDDSLAASSGFADSVMEAVRVQAAEDRPRPFPWIRFGAGVAACGVMAVQVATAVEPLLEEMRAPAGMGLAMPVVCYATASLLVALGLLWAVRLAGKS